MNSLLSHPTAVYGDSICLRVLLNQGTGNEDGQIQSSFFPRDSANLGWFSDQALWNWISQFLNLLLLLKITMETHIVHPLLWISCSKGLASCCYHKHSLILSFSYSPSALLTRRVFLHLLTIDLFLFRAIYYAMTLLCLASHEKLEVVANCRFQLVIGFFQLLPILIICSWIFFIDLKCHLFFFLQQLRELLAGVTLFI